MQPSDEFVVLVDEQDNDLGVMEKLEAHLQGRLHRAISVFIFNSRHQMLLQQRASGKYHSPLLWTNACCSHPRQDETPPVAAKRRLMEEMGLECPLQPAFKYLYKADVGDGLTEHELDHVFIGHTDAAPQPDAHEVSNWRYASINEIRMEMTEHPEQFTTWFRMMFPRFIQEVGDNTL